MRERELYESGARLSKTQPAHFVGVFNRQKGGNRGRELARFGYASLEASKLLARQ